MRNSGRALEARIAHDNQALYEAGLGVVIRVPTHEYSRDGERAKPSREPKVDFMGTLGSRAVLFEAKSGSGKLTPIQKALLTAADKCGALCFVHRETHLVMMDGSTVDLYGRCWWQAIQEEGL